MKLLVFSVPDDTDPEDLQRVANDALVTADILAVQVDGFSVHPAAVVIPREAALHATSSLDYCGYFATRDVVDAALNGVTA